MGNFFFLYTSNHILLSHILTYDADDEGEQVNDAVEKLYVFLRLVPKNSVDQDGWKEGN